MREIASQGRDATGVRVMNLDEGQIGGRGGPGDGGERGRGVAAGSLEGTGSARGTQPLAMKVMVKGAPAGV